jgi:hypothetical protein
MKSLKRFRVPVLAILLLLGGRWLLDSFGALLRDRERDEKSHHVSEIETANHASLKARREYVLEIIGLGVTYEKYRQGKLWDALQQGGAYTTIRETDPKKYPWTAMDKIGQSGNRACDALENGAKGSPMHWGVPSFYASSPIASLADPSSKHGPIGGLGESAETTGMSAHFLVTTGWELSERPDQLLERIFAFFDTHSEVPYIVLIASDGSALRDGDLLPGSEPLVKTGYIIPELPDTTAVFVLARRERVEPLRPFTWEDKDSMYVQDALRPMYYDVKTSVGYRNPAEPEWLSATAKFAKDGGYPGTYGVFEQAWRNLGRKPPSGWKPTPWFPLPWDEDQMDTFDRMPSLGFLHRPIFVKFEDEHGKPITQRDERQKLLAAGWQHALETLPDPERQHGPARIIAAYGNHADHAIAMERLLHDYAAQGGPKIDSSEKAQFINTDRRLGNTGAATFFMQMAIGVMGSYIDGGPSAAINLRDPAGASIVFISPPTEEKRRHQVSSAILFKHSVTPAIDPKNYETPTVRDLAKAAGQPVPEDQH